MAKYIAIYLPQFHPVPENNEWYGEGFTEWTNVARAKPLFRGHYQPQIPKDLGFYDLRLPESRRAQAELAKQYGIEAFCYWHYWFGNGKRILEMPYNETVKDKTISLPFCLAWANESWKRKLWDKNAKDETILEQTYPGEQDIINHFYSLIDGFKDPRYYRVDGKLLFLIYHPLDVEYIDQMIPIWRDLARKEGLNDFYFVGGDYECRDKEKIMQHGFNSIYDDNVMNIHHQLSLFNKLRLYVQRNYFHMPTVFEYKDAIKYMIIPEDYDEDVIPMIAPNWDHSPRSGRKSRLFINSEPKYFDQLLGYADSAVKNKKPEHQIVLIRAWNEWGEGNYLEPDIKYGRGYLDAIKRHKEMHGE